MTDSSRTSPVLILSMLFVAGNATWERMKDD